MRMVDITVVVSHVYLLLRMGSTVLMTFERMGLAHYISIKIPLLHF